MAAPAPGSDHGRRGVTSREVATEPDLGENHHGGPPTHPTEKVGARGVQTHGPGATRRGQERKSRPDTWSPMCSLGPGISVPHTAPTVALLV